MGWVRMQSCCGTGTVFVVRKCGGPWDQGTTVQAPASHLALDPSSTAKDTPLLSNNGAT